MQGHNFLSLFQFQVDALADDYNSAQNDSDADTNVDNIAKDIANSYLTASQEKCRRIYMT